MLQQHTRERRRVTISNYEGWNSSEADVLYTIQDGLIDICRPACAAAYAESDRVQHGER